MVNVRNAPSGDLQSALKNATDLLLHDASLAEEQVLEILKIYPESTRAKRILASAYRLRKLPQQGLNVLAPLVAGHSDSPGFLHEFAKCLGAVGRGEDAVKALRRAVSINPKHAESWQTLGHQLAVMGEGEASRDAFDRHFELSTPHPELAEAIRLLREKKLGKAESIVRDLLKKHPTDVTALRTLSDIGFKLGRFKDAALLLEACLELAPDFHGARHAYAQTLLRLQKPEEALAQAERLLVLEPNNPNFLALKASILIKIGDQVGALAIYENLLHEASQKPEEALAQAERLLVLEPNNPNFLALKASILIKIGDQVGALAIYENLLHNHPHQARSQMSYGHTLKTVGRLDEAIEAYRTCIQLSPGIGEAYWSLANLKTFRFSDEDIETMRRQVTTEGGDPEDQAHIAFALGKALEDRSDFDESFKFYRRGNAIRRIENQYNTKINVFDSV